MNKNNRLEFLKPRLINILLTLVILCLPLFREQYNQGEYVTWYRPITLMIGSMQKPQQPLLLLVMVAFSLIVYGVVSVAIVRVKKWARS